MNPGIHMVVLLRRTWAFRGGYLRASSETFSYHGIRDELDPKVRAILPS